MNIEVTLVRLESKFDAMDEKLDYIKEGQDHRLNVHAENIKSLNGFRNKTNGVWLAIAGLSLIAGIVVIIMRLAVL
jgi:hypothetical protein